MDSNNQNETVVLSDSDSSSSTIYTFENQYQANINHLLEKYQAVPLENSNSENLKAAAEDQYLSSSSSDSSFHNDKPVISAFNSKHSKTATNCEYYSSIANVCLPGTSSNNAIVEGQELTTEDNPHEVIQDKTSRKRKSTNDKLSKAMEKAAKIQEKQQKRQAAEKEKALRKAQLEANKHLNPNECHKFVTVFIDTNITSQSYSTSIVAHVTAAEFHCQIQSQMIPLSITWTRKTPKSFMNDEDQLISTFDISTVEEVLIIMYWKDFIMHVRDKSLTSYVTSAQSLLNARVSLLIFGLAGYFRYQKSQKNQELQNKQKRHNDRKSVYEEAPSISRRSIEFTLTELQFLCNCCYRLAETPEDVASVVVQFTKAIAQAPFKQEKNLKYQQCEWYMAGENKDCVRVDKDGNGLQRLWNQQLTMFPLARLETAEAISSKFPTPSSLMQAYKKCSSKVEAERLLQDIPIRRAAGPVISVRKIGPELSKKVYLFFTSTDGNIFL